MERGAERSPGNEVDRSRTELRQIYGLFLACALLAGFAAALWSVRGYDIPLVHVPVLGFLIVATGGLLWLKPRPIHYALGVVALLLAVLGYWLASPQGRTWAAFYILRDPSGGSTWGAHFGWLFKPVCPLPGWLDAARSECGGLADSPRSLPGGRTCLRVDGSRYGGIRSARRATRWAVCGGLLCPPLADVCLRNAWALRVQGILNAVHPSWQRVDLRGTLSIPVLQDLKADSVSFTSPVAQPLIGPRRCPCQPSLHGALLLVIPKSNFPAVSHVQPLEKLGVLGEVHRAGATTTP